MINKNILFYILVPEGQPSAKHPSALKRPSAMLIEKWRGYRLVPM